MVTLNQKDLPSDHTLTIGTHLLMQVHLPPTNPKLQFAHEIVTHIRVDGEEARAHEIAWKNTDYPKWMIDIERWQVVSEVDVQDNNDVQDRNGGNGRGEGDGLVVSRKKTLYETRCVFCGPGAYVVKPFHAKALSDSFQVLAEDLKKYCEGTRGGVKGQAK